MSIYIIIFCLIFMNISTIIILKRSNKELKKEIRDANIWCQHIINQLAEKETMLDKQLNDIIKLIRHNDVSQKVTDLVYYEEKCPFHDSVYDIMLREQSNMINHIENIKKDNEEFMESIIDENIFSEN